MFDFLKRKSYKIENANGTKKLVIAKKYTAKDFESYINRLNDVKSMLEAIISALTEVKEKFTLKDKENLPEYMKKKISDQIDWNFNEEDKILKVFNSLDIQKKLEKAKETSEETNSSVNKTVTETAETEQPKGKSATEDTEEETNNGEEELDLNSILKDVSTDNNNEQSKEESFNKKVEQFLNSKDLIRTADKDPGSSKYRAEGIKERLLEINKEVVNVKTPGVTYVGGVSKDVITPGPKSTMVRVKEEVVRPNNVVQNVKIKIMRDEGEKETLLPERNIKMPKGDIVVKKAATDNQKVKQLPEDKRAEYYARKEKAKLENKSAEEFDRIDDEFGVSASLYDQAMNKIFRK